MKCTGRIKKDAAAFVNPAVLICAGSAALAALICMIACGNYYLYSFLLKPRHAPPAFLFFFCFVFTCALLGFSSGTARFAVHCRCGADLLIIDVLAALFFVLFYVSFMSMAAFVVALIMLICALALLLFGVRQSAGSSLFLTVLQVLAALFVGGYALLTASVILLN